MKLAGFNFTKIDAEKKKDSYKDLKVETKIDILEIKEVNSDLIKSKEDFLGVKFIYTINYDPSIANIEFNGNILLALDPKKAKEILKEWKKKKFSQEFQLTVFNLILKKSSIRALQLEEELNLPSHFRLPYISSEGLKKN